MDLMDFKDFTDFYKFRISWIIGLPWNLVIEGFLWICRYRGGFG